MILLCLSLPIFAAALQKCSCFAAFCKTAISELFTCSLAFHIAFKCKTQGQFENRFLKLKKEDLKLENQQFESNQNNVSLHRAAQQLSLLYIIASFALSTHLSELSY